MRRLAVVGVFAVTSLAAAATSPDLGRIRKVYVLSMGSGLDQYIANRLAETGSFEVTTDPKAADAILTDRVGEQFERHLKELYPELDPKPVKEEAKPTDSKATDSKASKSDAEKSTVASYKDDRPVSSFSRGRGNIFLIDRASRNVVWSTYERPKNRSSDELNHVAGRIAKNLQKAAGSATKP